eukprot:12448998-Alexandrium_andersonii.AAC.1
MHAAPPAPAGRGDGEPGGRAGAAAAGGMAGADDAAVAAWAARGAGSWRAGGHPAVRTGYR